MFIPTEDYAHQGLDLNKKLILRPAATFFMTAAETSPQSNIRRGDLLVVDRAEAPTVGRIVVAVVNGELVIRQLSPQWRQNDGLEIWGVVLWLIRAL